MTQESKRLSWDQVWMATAIVVAQRSDCTRAQVGAVIVDRTQRVLATVYNGPPAGFAGHCSTGACPRGVNGAGPLAPNDYGNCISVHAELNALLYSDRSDRRGGSIYITRSPCFDCAKSIANSGLVRAVYNLTDLDLHNNPETVVEFLSMAGLTVVAADRRAPLAPPQLV